MKDVLQKFALKFDPNFLFFQPEFPKLITSVSFDQIHQFGTLTNRANVIAAQKMLECYLKKTQQLSTMPVKYASL